MQKHMASRHIGILVSSNVNKHRVVRWWWSWSGKHIWWQRYADKWISAGVSAQLGAWAIGCVVSWALHLAWRSGCGKQLATNNNKELEGFVQDCEERPIVGKAKEVKGVRGWKKGRVGREGKQETIFWIVKTMGSESDCKLNTCCAGVVAWLLFAVFHECHRTSIVIWQPHIHVTKCCLACHWHD